jgi:prevent-host-death family protein
MTLHRPPLKAEVGVRELHDRLSRYVQHVKDGGEVVVTMRGRRVARLVPVDEIDPLADLRARGLVRDPTTPAQPARAPSPAQGRKARVRPRRRPTALIVYFDTSALIKLIFDETGSELAVELWDRAQLLVSSQLVYPEARAARRGCARLPHRRTNARQRRRRARGSLHPAAHRRDRRTAGPPRRRPRRATRPARG